MVHVTDSAILNVDEKYMKKTPGYELIGKFDFLILNTESVYISGPVSINGNVQYTIIVDFMTR